MSHLSVDDEISRHSRMTFKNNCTFFFKILKFNCTDEFLTKELKDLYK